MRERRLGEFVLVGRLGAGGMGTVFRARHQPTGRVVAVKLLASSLAGEERLRAAFADEVRAVAALAHPNVVAVYDHGEVTAAEEGGPLVVGAPWMVMELAEGGDLGAWRGRVGPLQLVGILRSLLDALAHAHARRVLHRDLKPQNVLIGGDRPGLKLSDFGMADLLGDDRPRGGGTPAYMAPEQLANRWRDFGAWTDLYALGCLAWSLAVGSPPFGYDAEQVAVRQHEPLPDAPEDWPAELATWVGHLLNPDPWRRYRTAAAAARDLSALDLSGLSATDEVVLEEPSIDVPTAPALPTLDWYSRPETEEVTEVEVAPGRSGPRQKVGVPADWRGTSLDDPIRPLAGSGLRLMRLRHHRVVGREVERDQLWNALRAAVSERHPKVLLVRGEAGSGKSRLAEWLGERAHELGAATVLRATASAEPAPGDGLVAMAGRVWRSVGLTGDPLRARLREGLGAEPEVALVARVLEGAVVSRAERHGALTWMLGRLSRSVPAVVWLDDAHHDEDALTWAASLPSAREGRAVVVLTLRDDVLAERPERAAIVRAAIEAGAVEVRLGPLDAQSAFLRELTGLRDDLAGEVLRRTAGNPLYAVQLVEAWSDAGLLASTDSGLAFTSDATLPVPPDLDAVWRARLRAALDGLGPDAQMAVERAAFLGDRPDDAEWEEAARGLPVAAVRNRLLERGLLLRIEGGLSFAHGLLRELLLEQAGPRAEAHHDACAAMLAARGEMGERYGRHLLALGRHAEAIEPLLDGVRNRIRAAEGALAAAALRDVEQALAAVAPPPGDRRLAETALLRAENLQMGYRTDGWAAAEQAIAVARAGGHRDLLARGLRLQGMQALDEGRIEPSAALLEEALAVAPTDADRLPILACLCTTFQARGDLAGARRVLDQAAALPPDPRWAANLAIQRGHVLRYTNDLDGAAEAFQAALVAYEERGVRRGVAQALNGLGTVEMGRERMDAAADAFRRALHQYGVLGSSEGLFVRANLATIELNAGRWEAAEAAVGSGAVEARDNGMVVVQAILELVLTICAIGRDRWAEASDHAELAVDLLGRSGYQDPGLVELARMGSSMAEAAERPGLVRMLQPLIGGGDGASA
ncbi:MAG: protein kinase [Alphaproteobacteria bacterium]|nr:protein kinase [Alphaproteobacteria bacterium]